MREAVAAAVAEYAFEVGVALGGLAAAVLVAGLDELRGQVSPGAQMLRGREPAHVEADLGQDHLGGVEVYPGMSASRCRAGRGWVGGVAGCALPGLGAGVAPSWGSTGCSGWAVRRQSCSMRVVRRSISAVRLSIWPSRIVASSAWWSSNLPSSASHEVAALVPHDTASQVGQRLRVTFTRDQRVDHVPHRHRGDLRCHRGDLDQASSSNFSSRCQ